MKVQVRILVSLHCTVGMPMTSLLLCLCHMHKTVLVRSEVLSGCYYKYRGETWRSPQAAK